MFNYKNQSNELRVIEFNIVGEMAMSENYPAEDKIQQVEINGEKGVLVEHSRGGVTLTFNKDNIHYILNSNEASPIKPNEMINIASKF